MSPGWETKRLSDVCSAIQDGAHQSPQRQYQTPGEGRFLYITSKNIRTNFIDLTDVTYVERDFHDQIYPRCRPSLGDVLLTKDGASTGNVALNTIDEPFSLLSSVCLIKTDPCVLDPAFLCYYLQSPLGLAGIVGGMTGAAIKRIILRDIKGARVPLPPLPEQRRTVGILDRAFAEIATAKARAEKNFQNARVLFESHLQAAFRQCDPGLAKKRLSEVCEIISTLVDPRDPKHIDLPHIGGANIAPKTGALLNLKSARLEGLVSGKFVFDETMVLYSKIRPYLMKAARPNFRGLCSADIYPLAPKTGQMDRDYLFHLLLSPRFTNFANMGSARAAMPKVNRDHLFAFRAHIPSLQAQKKVAATLDALQGESERLQSLYQRKLAALDELKKSLLNEAFSGRL